MMTLNLPSINHIEKDMSYITHNYHTVDKPPVWAEDQYGAYVTWHTIPAFMPINEQTHMIDPSDGNSISFLSDWPSPIPGVDGTTVNNCHHFKLSVDAVVKWKQEVQYPLMKDIVLGPYTYNDTWAAFFQVLFDKKGRSFWTLEGQPSPVITARSNVLWITHWTFSETSKTYVGRQWYNGYGGFNYMWRDQKSGQWYTTVDGERYNLPLTKPPVPKTTGSYYSYKRIHHARVGESRVDFSSLDPEMLFYLKDPYLRKTALNHVPAVSRQAWLSFELYNSNLLVELMDSLFAIDSIKDLLPTAMVSRFSKSVKYTREWQYNTALKRWQKPVLTNSGRRIFIDVPMRDVRKFSMTPVQLVKAIAAGRLEYMFGLKLPYYTLRNLWADTKEPWALALTNRLDPSMFIQPVLRHRTQYDNLQVSVSVQQRLDPDYFFVEVWKALYQSGVLMTFEGIWDLIPGSFVVDWFSKGAKSIFQATDATTISQMVRVDQWSWSYKYNDQVKIHTPDGDVVGNILYYCREYSTGTPPIGVEMRDLKGSFRLRNLPDLGAVLSRFLH
jgi:hypothetical protein